MAESEMKYKKLREHVPAAFLKEYQATIDGHLKTLVEQREHMERGACKDPRLFARRMPKDLLAKAESDITVGRNNLKAWRNCLHVCTNNTASRDTSKSEYSRSATTASLPSKARRQPPAPGSRTDPLGFPSESKHRSTVPP